jgi:hypothetical protein
MKRIKYLSVLLLSVLVLSSCSSDDDSGISDIQSNDLILDKWWFDSDDFAGDLYFNSNGNYTQRVELLGTLIESTGVWSWEDLANGIVKIDNINGQQLNNELWLRLTNIQETTMTVQQSLTGEADSYSFEIFYQDTDPNN